MAPMSTAKRFRVHLLVASLLAGVGLLVALLYRSLRESSGSPFWTVVAILPVAYLLGLKWSEGGGGLRSRLILGLFAMVAGAVAFVLVLDRSVLVAVIALVLAVTGAGIAIVNARSVRRGRGPRG
ncbi:MULTISPECIES: hypothetical protein [unclassified Micromonospora]|uniref:hypothetical protein n=1 Tax=Micromonospora TaxID=1873 RepID=UPI001C23D87E|nr:MULTISPECIES: hypothetical protein [unclassified Micromonospora]MBU8860105.1 hypothetical protein [Micromonospora sp. WMMB482]MDM4779636.1 hypothetical protein [Micromonospora sp. b486]